MLFKAHERNETSYPVFFREKGDHYYTLFQFTLNRCMYFIDVWLNEDEPINHFIMHDEKDVVDLLQQLEEIGCEFVNIFFRSPREDDNYIFGQIKQLKSKNGKLSISLTDGTEYIDYFNCYDEDKTLYSLCENNKFKYQRLKR